MRRNSFLTFLKEKSFIIVLALMLISAGTMAALFSLGEDDQAESNQVAQKEESVQESAPVKTTETEEEKEQQNNTQESILENPQLINYCTNIIFYFSYLIALIHRIYSFKVNLFLVVSALYLKHLCIPSRFLY